MFHAKTSQTHDIPTKLRYWIPWTWKGHVLPAKNKYADSKSSAYLRGTWLKTKKYQTVILEVRELSHPENNSLKSRPTMLFYCINTIRDVYDLYAPLYQRQWQRAKHGECHHRQCVSHPVEDYSLKIWKSVFPLGRLHSLL
jgi:hypothetical protein